MVRGWLQVIGGTLCALSALAIQLAMVADLWPARLDVALGAYALLFAAMGVVLAGGINLLAARRGSGRRRSR